MKRDKEQIEIWNLGSSTKLQVVYKITKIIIDKKVDLNTSFIEEFEFDSEKYIENQLSPVRLCTKEYFNDSLETEIVYSKTSANVNDNKKLNNSTHPPCYPKKTPSLFKNNKENKNEFDKNKLTAVNNSNSLNNTTIPTPSLNSLDFEIVDIKNFENQNNFSYYKDSFIEAFFIAGLPKKKARLISDSEYLIPNCKHKICGQLPAYKPDILKKLIMGEFLDKAADQTNFNLSTNSNTTIYTPQAIFAKFDLSQTTTNLCFPHGIKLCYHLNEDEIFPSQNFITITTNESGRHHYIYVYNYFQKVSLIDFKNNHDVDPVTDYNRYNKNVQNILEKIGKSQTCGISARELAKLEDKYQEVYMLTCELASRDYIFIPQSACIVSKLPYNLQMEKAINALMKMTIDEKVSEEEVNKYLLNLIYEIPIPPINKKLLFYIPYFSSPIEITGKIYKDLPVSSYNLSSLFKYFSSENMLNIYYLILFEQKLLFVYDDYEILSEISQLFVSLIYPMEWIHTYIPIISEEMTKYLKSFMPFIMGIDTVLLNKMIKNEEFDEDNNIFIINIGKNKKSSIETSNEYVKNKNGNSKNIMKSIPVIPDETYKEVVKYLDDLMKIDKEISDKKVNNTGNGLVADSSDTNSIQKLEIIKINKQIKNSFIKGIALLIGDYKKYVSFIEDSNYFNSDSFLQSRSDQHLKFYREFIETGIFKNFLYNIKDNSNAYFDKMCNRHISFILCKSNLAIRNKKMKSVCSYAGKSLLNSYNKNDRSAEVRSYSIKKEKKESKPLKIENSTKLHSDIPFGCDSNKKYTFESPKRTLKSQYQVTPSSKSNNEASLTPTKRIFSLSNDLNSDTNSMNENKSIEHNESYLIAPYYFSNQINSVLPIEELMSEKFIYSSGNSNNIDIIMKKRIFPKEKQKEFNFENFPKKFRNYIIAGHEFNRYSMHKQIKLSNSSKNHDEFNAGNLNSLSKDSIKEVINDYLKNIISTENFSKIDKFVLNNALNAKYGRSHFSKILLQNKFRENRSQILNEKGFEDLFQMIFNCLITCENEETYFNDAIKITKSSFFYYKLGKGKDQIFIFQEILKKTNSFAIWLNEDFWLKWFKIESEERSNDFNNIEDYYFFLLTEIATFMNNLKIEIKFIINCIVHNIGATLIKKDTVLLEDLEKTIIKQKVFSSKQNED